jgi:hypothetical protein
MERMADAAKVGLIPVSDDVDKMRAINAYRPGQGLERGTQGRGLNTRRRLSTGPSGSDQCDL